MHFARMAMLATGIIVPVVETIRRWSTWREYPPAMFDDYVIGAIALWVCWITRQEEEPNRSWLAAFIGFACCGWPAMSTLSSLYSANRAVLDPSGLSAYTEAAIKAAFPAFGLAVLARVLRERPHTAGSSRVAAKSQ